MTSRSVTSFFNYVHYPAACDFCCMLSCYCKYECVYNDPQPNVKEFSFRAEMMHALNVVVFFLLLFLQPCNYWIWCILEKTM